VSEAATRHVLVLLMLALISGPASGQAPPPSTVEVSAGTVPLGATFELRLSVSVPSGRTVYFPDKLPSTDAVESHGAARWKAQPAAGGATLSVTYPLIALGIGDVSIPGFDVRIGPLDAAAGVASLPGGSSIGAWDHAWDRAGDAGPASGVLAGVAARRVRVASVFQLEGVLAGVGPMPAADVIGASWNTTSLALLLASSCVLVAVLATTMRKRLRSRMRSEGSPVIVESAPDDAKREALNELDGLLALGLHTAGRTREFYTMSSGIVRRYAERLDPRWGPGLTSTELVRELQAHGNAVPVDELWSEMNAAEVVKFGQLRPEIVAAEAHWRAVRSWIEKSAGRTRGR
jgi:hypothetical protein